ncbi:hypothetical protein TNCT_134591 [Trichonephila clavata]|uniref:Uncharacterized protein n=1 Tax=Trichonephila clavata TaxID=2740835 RepID=A0A8X6LME7_TRICU|nr:hypothetical protein TNCT_134591 [Trichonephila clavata]
MHRISPPKHLSKRTVKNSKIGTVQEKLKNHRVIQRGKWDELPQDDKMLAFSIGRIINLSFYCLYCLEGTLFPAEVGGEKRKVSIPQNVIINSYNKYMDCADLCDYLAYCRRIVKN